jgi:hypothetical protein
LEVLCCLHFLFDAYLTIQNFTRQPCKRAKNWGQLTFLWLLISAQIRQLIPWASIYWGVTVWMIRIVAMLWEQILKSVLSPWCFNDLFLWFFKYVVSWALQNYFIRDNTCISCLNSWLLYFMWRLLIKTLLFYFTFWATARYTFNIIQFRVIFD